MKIKKNMHKPIPVGTAHFLRNGAGPHKDKVKEASKTACRDFKKNNSR